MSTTKTPAPVVGARDVTIVQVNKHLWSVATWVRGEGCWIGTGEHTFRTEREARAHYDLLTLFA